MNNKTFIQLILCLVLISFGCTKEKTSFEDVTPIESISASQDAERDAARATQIDGIGFFDPTDDCNTAAPGEGAAYAVRMTGDLEGCLYIFIDEYECSPSGTYREVGREHFVGSYNGEEGDFWTTYKFEARYEGCNPDG